MDERELARARFNELRKMAATPRLVCDCEDLLPFAWRTPLRLDGRRPSKVLRELAQQEALRNAPPAPPKPRKM